MASLEKLTHPRKKIYRYQHYRNLNGTETASYLYVNTIPPFLCCSKTPISFEVAMHPAKRLHFVALLTARCGHVFNFLPKSVSRIFYGLMERDWVLTFSTFLLPAACNADTIAEATWTIRHWH